MRPVLSLIVLGYKNFEAVTRTCLESLRPWFQNPHIEILVVDNGSPDGSAQLTEQWCQENPGPHCLLSAENRGFAGGMNWGASQAQGEWLLLVNNDTVFPDLALEAMLKVIAEAPANVAMLGPVTNAAGNGQRLWKPSASHSEWLEIGRQLHQNPTHRLMPCYRCDFFCIAIRSDVWEQLSGLDEAFGLGYYEDFDFSLRLRKAGFEQAITEDVFVLHTGSASFKGSKEARRLIKQNKKLLLLKHPQAIFQHTRFGNLTVLQAYRGIKNSGGWNGALELRQKLRLSALVEDAPRSIIKRLLWRLNVKNALRSFLGAGQ